MDTATKQFLLSSIKTLEHFGFSPLPSLLKQKECKNCTHPLVMQASAQERRIDALHGMLTGGAKSFTEGNLHTLEKPLFFYSLEQVPRTGDVALSLHVFFVNKSIAESLLIQTTRALAQEAGFLSTQVRINSLGDHDSSLRYNRELTNYLRKRIDQLPAAARELMKQDGITALMHLIEKEHEFAYKSPSPLEYLSDASRKHFREIVEYLDMSEIPYEIDPRLLGHFHCYSDALFAIDVLDDEDRIDANSPLYIRGGRYNEFMSRYVRSSISAAGAIVIFKDKKAPPNPPRVTRGRQPSVYVVHLGFGPKIRSLLLIDELRKEGVPVYQNLACDSLSNQLLDAEEKNVTHTVIIGQKEFMEGCAIVRDMKERKQENVPFDILTKRIKKVAVPKV